MADEPSRRRPTEDELFFEPHAIFGPLLAYCRRCGCAVSVRGGGKTLHHRWHAALDKVSLLVVGEELDDE